MLDEPLDGVFARHASKLILFEPVDEVDEAAIVAVSGVREAKRTDDLWEVTPEHDPLVTIRQIVDTLGARRIEIKRPTLEDIFIVLVDGGAELVSQAGGER